MCGMFNSCYSLKELNISNFNFSHVKHMSQMFGYCSNEFKKKMSNQIPNLKKEAFRDI